MKRKNSFVTLGMAALAGAVMLAAGAGNANAAERAQSDRASTLIVDIDGGKVNAPDLWNPYAIGHRRDHGFHQLMLEPLFMLNYMTGKIEPWLGRSMTPNRTLDVWTLKLDPKAAWSDGTPLTSADVVFSVQLVQNNKDLTGAGTAGVREWVKSVAAPDPQTVVFTLNNPNPRFQLDYFSVKIWGSFAIVPKHIWDGKDPVTFKNYEPGQSPVFSGAYRLKSFNAGATEFIYERNDNWWGVKAGKKLPAPKTIIFTWLGSVENRSAAMADGNMDSLGDITLGAFKAIQAKNKTAIAWYDKAPWAVLDPCSRVLQFNTTLEPWNDPDMRWAINYAINRDQIVTIAYEGTTSKSRMPYPMYPPIQRLDKLAEGKGLYQKYDIWTTDPKKTEAILTKKGYAKGGDGYWAKDGKQLSLVITTHESFIEKQRIADVIVEQLQAVGINATHKKEAGQLWGDNLAFGKFEAQMGWQNCGSVNEPWATLDTLNRKWIKPVGERVSGNGFRWDNKVFSDAVDALGKLPLGDRRADALFLTAYEQYLKELPTIPITQAKKLIPFSQTTWTNFPSDKNKYAASWNWWQTFPQILQQIRPAK